ncbi:MAG: hypothetical protein ACOCX1_03095, partial [Fimbriimonadaceae bacterium]
MERSHLWILSSLVLLVITGGFLATRPETGPPPVVVIHQAEKRWGSTTKLISLDGEMKHDETTEQWSVNVLVIDTEFGRSDCYETHWTKDDDTWTGEFGDEPVECAGSRDLHITLLPLASVVRHFHRWSPTFRCPPRPG